MSRQKVKREGTKELIINTALELFNSVGYENTTIDLILEKADIAKGTFYYNFKSKEDVMENIAKKLMFSFEQEVKELSEKNVSPLIIIEKIVYQLAEWAMSNPEINKALIIERFKFLSNNKANYEGSFRRVTSYFIEKAQKEGSISSEINNIELAQILGMMLLQAMLHWHYDNSINLNEKFKNCLNVFFKGVII